MVFGYGQLNDRVGFGPNRTFGLIFGNITKELDIFQENRQPTVLLILSPNPTNRSCIIIDRQDLEP